MEWSFIIEKLMPAAALMIGLYFTVSNPIKKSICELKNEITQIKLDMKDISLKSVSQADCKAHRREIWHELRGKHESKKD